MLIVGSNKKYFKILCENPFKKIFTVYRRAKYSLKESLEGICDRHDRCPAGRDDPLSDYGVEMYPGRSIWARGVLALGAGILLLSGLRWWSESTIRTKGSDDARSIRIDGSENDDPSILERSKESVSYLSRDVDDVLVWSIWWQIEAEPKRRLMWKGSRDEKDDDRAIDTTISLTSRNDGSEVTEETGSKADDSRSRLDDPRSRETSINARSSDRHRSLDRDPGTNNEDGIFTEFSRSIIADKRQRDKIEENSPEGRVSILESLEGDERSTRRFAAGMQEDQLLFFHGNRERAESSAEAIQDRKDLSEERDSARRRWHETSREGNLREFEVENVENNDKSDVHETDLTINKKGRSQDALFKDLFSRVNSEFRDESDNEGSSDNASAFQILDSIIPADNKRGKVTRGEDSKDLMIANNFVLASQDRRIDTGTLIPEYRPIFARNKRKITRSDFTKKITRSIDRREDAQENGRKSDNTGSTTIQKADRHETVVSDRRKRHANYYSAQSVTPMAYVHIQPAYPATPPTSRKCVRCMVVYKPCPSQPRPPPRIVLPKYKYHKPANTWRGLKYGE